MKRGLFTLLMLLLPTAAPAQNDDPRPVTGHLAGHEPGQNATTARWTEPPNHR
jgi:hypothetical protein